MVAYMQVPRLHYKLVIQFVLPHSGEQCGSCAGVARVYRSDPLPFGAINT